MSKSKGSIPAASDVVQAEEDEPEEPEGGLLQVRQQRQDDDLLVDKWRIKLEQIWDF